MAENRDKKIWQKLLVFDSLAIYLVPYLVLVCTEDETSDVFQHIPSPHILTGTV